MITEQIFYDNSNNIRIEQMVDTETNLIEGISKHYKNNKLISILMYKNGILHGESKRFNEKTTEVIIYDNGLKIKALVYTDSDLSFNNLISEIIFDDKKIMNITKYKNGVITSKSIFLSQESFIIEYFENNILVKRVKTENGKKITTKFKDEEIVEKSIADSKDILIKYEKNGDIEKYYSKELHYSETKFVDELGLNIEIKSELCTYNFNGDSNNLFDDFSLGFHKYKFNNNGSIINSELILNNKKEIDLISYSYKLCEILVVFKSNIPYEMVITKNDNKFLIYFNKKNYFNKLKFLFKGIPFNEIISINKIISNINVSSLISQNIKTLENRKEIIINEFINNE